MGKRVAGVLPLAGASVAAVALAGVAVFTVTHAGCADAGQYMRHDDGTVELVGSCVDPAELPSTPTTDQIHDLKPAEPASHLLDPVSQ